MKASHNLIARLALTEKIIRETPIIRLADEHLDLYAKLEFLNGVGSVKDRPALWILKRAIERGEVGPDTTVVESSSGNFACALATFCRMLTLKFVPVIDPCVPPVYESYLRTHCERVVKVEEFDDAGGYLKSRLGMVKTLLTDIPESYWPNQYGNPDGMDAHYRLTAAEICRDLPKLDYAFIGVSSAGTVSGLSRRLKEHYPSVRIIAVDAEGSVIFGQKPKRRHISGIGSSISPPLLEHALIDDIVIVPESDTVIACHDLLERHGLFVGGSTGTAYSAIRRYFSVADRKGRAKVLFLCCDRGTAYLHNVFNSEWAAWRAGKAEAAPRTLGTWIPQQISHSQS
jgi:N-(2-amino-2-carboxyethyl)-L-glutamate synthase